MSDNYDQLALSWVRKEINNTLDQARQGLENFAEDRQDQTQIQFCINCLHQVQGTLQMLDFSGAAKLALEMETLAEKMSNDSQYAVDSSFEILMQALLQMPGYLERVEEGHKDIPVILLPLLNQIRAASNLAPILERELFSADTTDVLPPKAVEQATESDKTSALQDNVKKLRAHFQKGLAGVIRGENVKESLARIHKVLLRLEALTEGKSVAKLWWVADGFIFSITEKGLYKKKEIHQLLGRVDKQIKRIADLGADALSDVIPEDLLSQLLYFVARSKSKNARVVNLKKEFDLESVLSDSEQVKQSQARLAKPDTTAIAGVADALNEELTKVKDQLDLFVRVQSNDPLQLQSLLDSLTRISDTLTLLELSIPRDVIRQQIKNVQSIIDSGQQPQDSMVMDVAGALLFVEANLKNIDLNAGEEDVKAEDASERSKEHAKDAQVDEATQTLIKVARRSMQSAKDIIIGYIAAGFEPEVMNDVPSLLDEVIGGVKIVNFDSAAEILETAKVFIENKIVGASSKPNEIYLDALADVITSVEYYLEASEEGKYRGLDSILKGAQDSIIKLTEASEETEVEDSQLADEKAVAETISETEATESQQITSEKPDEVGQLKQEKPIEVAAPVAASSAEKEIDETLIDDDVLEIFLEEAEEEIETLSEMVPRWTNDPQDQEALTTIRRSFHTLKGSGRLVGAKVIGEVSWSVENMLNKVIEESIPAETPVISVLNEVQLMMPRLVECFQSKQEPAEELGFPQLIAKAEHIAAGKPLAEFDYAEPEQAQEEKVEVEVGDVQEEAIDPVLLEIFAAEADSHIESIGEYIASAPKDGTVAVTDDLIRALHTLKGSAKMANVEAIAGLAGPLEKYARLVKGSGQRFDQAVVGLIAESHEYLKQTLGNLKESKPVDLSKEQELLDKLSSISNASDVDSEAVEDSSEQRFTAIFLTEGLDILQEVTQLSQKLKEDLTNLELKESIKTEVHAFFRGSEVVAIEQLILLAQATEKLVSFAENAEVLTEDFFSLLQETVDDLTSMLNRIASEEDLDSPHSRIEKIDQWIAKAGISSAPEDMDVELVELFVEEGEELIESARELLARWVDNYNSKNICTELRRIYHTVKGSSRMAGAMNIGELGYAVEDIFNTALDFGRELSSVDHRLTVSATDKLEVMIAELKQLRWPAEANQEVNDIRRMLSPDEFKDEAIQLEEPQIEEPQIEEPQIEEPQIEEAQIEEAQIEEVQIEETQIEEVVSDADDGVLEVEEAIELETAVDEESDFETLKLDTASEDSQEELAEQIPTLDEPEAEELLLEETPESEFLESEILETESLESETFETETPESDYLEEADDRELESEEIYEEEFVAESTESDIELPILEVEVLEETALESTIEEPEEKIAESLSEQESTESESDIPELSDTVEEEVELVSEIEFEEADNSELEAEELLYEEPLQEESLREEQAEEESGELTEEKSAENVVSDSEEVVPLEEISNDIELVEELEQTEVEPIGLASEIEAVEIETADVETAEVETAEIEESDEAELEVELEVETEAELEAETEAEIIKLDLDEDGEEILEIYLEEAEELLITLDEALINWSDNLSDKESIDLLQRTLHTFKGGARLSDLTVLGNLTHEMETYFERINSGQLTAKSEDVDILVDGYDNIASLVNEVATLKQMTTPVNYMQALERLIRGDKQPSKTVEVVKPAEAIKPKETIKPTKQLEKEEPTKETGSADVSVDTIGPSSPVQFTGNLHKVELDEDGEEVLEIYLEEAEELLITLDEALHDWAGDLSNKEAIDLLQRALHTFKGGARLSDLVVLGDLTHEMETYFERINSGALKAKQEDVGFMLKGYDVIAGLVKEVEAERQMTVPEAYMASLNSLINGGAVADIDEVIEEGKPESLPSADVVSFEEKKQEVEHKQAQSKPADIIRVPSVQLEELVNLAGETSIFRSRLEQQMSILRYNLEEMSSTVDRLREQLRNLDIETDAQISYRKEISGEEYEDFDPLEMDRYTRQQELTRGLSESAVDLLSLKESLDTMTSDSETLLLQQGRINTEMQESLMRTRMIPFESLVPRLRRMVRQISSELDKTIELSISADGEMDRSVLERLIAPLEHMLRNAMDHGIEPPEERLASNKSETGKVKISLYRDGSEVFVKIQDDGRGLKLEAIRKKALERGLIKENSELSDHELQQLILEAGFSTAEKVTQISGRGVGMDVVSSEIKQMGGLIEIDSIEGKGSTFTIKLPFTVSVNHALMVQLGDDVFAIPLANIEGIVRVSPFELEEYYSNSDSAFEYAGVDYSMYSLGQLLDHSKTPNLKGVTQALPVLLLHGADHPTALQVDGLLGSREIVVKSIGNQLSSISGLSGATILGDGRVVLILDMPALIRRIDAIVTDEEHLEEEQSKAATEVDRIPRIMVVDDSITVRKVTSRLLERHDYEVITAKDGVDALSVLGDHKPDVMLLDIEMPRMDGFELATIIRHDENLKDLPIIMITSRTGDKHRERAQQIGVNQYMGKPFNEVDLIDSITALLPTKS